MDSRRPVNSIVMRLLCSGGTPLSQLADYSEIDSTLNAWALRHGLHIYTTYKDYDVRSVDVTGGSGKRYQIWIDAPDSEKQIGIHAWDYEKHTAEIPSGITQLANHLEDVYGIVQSWDSEFAKTLLR
jgi:hypothetical protein